MNGLDLLMDRMQTALTMHEFASCAVMAMITNSVITEECQSAVLEPAKTSKKKTGNGNTSSNSNIKLSMEDIDKINVQLLRLLIFI